MRDDLIENAATGHFLGWLVLASENQSKPQVMVQAWSNELPLHLRGHSAHEAKTAELSQRPVVLCGEWETYDGHERAVLAGAVRYFLILDDETHDESSEGLVDDAVVVEAAERTLTAVGN